MDGNYVRGRISALLLQRGISAHKLSISLGHSGSYIRSITSGKALPSMTEFLAICEYLNVTPKEFFDDGVEDPAYLRGLIADLKHLDAKQLEAVGALVRSMNKT